MSILHLAVGGLVHSTDGVEYEDEVQEAFFDKRAQYAFRKGAGNLLLNHDPCGFFKNVLMPALVY